MSDGAQSAVAYRTLIRATADTPASGDDLANIVTNALPDGAACFVTGTRVLYRFRKFSAIPAEPGIVIIPSAGGGRWIAEGVPVGADALWVVGTAANSTDSTSSTNWLQPQTNAFSLERGASAWSLTAAGCVLTYNGPLALYAFRMTFTLSWGVSATIFAAVSRNNDLIATEDGFAQGAEFFEFVDGESDQRAFSCERIEPVIAGVTIRPKFRATTTDQDLGIQRFTLSAIPIGPAT